MFKKNRRVNGWGTVLCSLAVFALLIAGCDSGGSGSQIGILRVVTSDFDGVAREHEFVCGNPVV